MSGDHTKISAKGGKNRWVNTTPEERREIMRMVAQKGWFKRKAKKP